MINIVDTISRKVIKQITQSGVHIGGSVFFDEDGKNLIVLSGSEIVFFSIKNMQRSGAVVCNAVIRSSAVSSDKKYLACGQIGGYISIFGLTLRELSRSIKPDSLTVNSLTFSPDSRYLAYSCDDEIYLLDLKNNRQTNWLVTHRKNIKALSFDKQGKYLASCSDDGEVIVWEVNAAKKLITVASNATTLRFSPTERFLILGADDGRIDILDIKAGTYRSMIDSADSFKYLDISQQNTLFALCGLNESLVKWDIGKQKLDTVFELPKGLAINAAKLSPTETYVAVADSDNKLRVWDLKRKSPLGAVAIPEYESDSMKMVFSRDEKYIAAASHVVAEYPFISAESIISVIEVKGPKILKILKVPHRIDFISFLADSRYLIYKSGFNSETKHVDLSSGNMKTIEKETFGISKDLQFLISKRYFGIDFCMFEVWRFPELIKVAGVPAMNDLNLIFCFSADKEYLIYSGNEDSNYKIQEMKSGKVVKICEGHRSPLTVITCTDKHIITVSRDRVLKLWNIDGTLVGTFYFFVPNILVVTTPEGFFSGTGNFNKCVHFVKGSDVYEFNQFYDCFYRPDLVEKKLKGEDISKYTGGLNIEDAVRNPPPKVTILSPHDDASSTKRTIAVKVQVKDTGGKIGDIRIHHNGKLVDSLGVYRLARTEIGGKRVKLAKVDLENPYQTTRGTALRRVWGDTVKNEIQEVHFTPAEGTMEKTYHITLISGENTISASAFNGTNTVMSAMESINIKADICKLLE